MRPPVTLSFFFNKGGEGRGGTSLSRGTGEGDGVIGDLLLAWSHMLLIIYAQIIVDLA